MEENLAKFLDGTTFEVELLKSLQKFVPRHIEDALNNTHIKYEEYGSEYEKRLKQILQHYGSIYSVLNDLDLTFYFLSKERHLILKHYPDLENQKDYYSYHFENYYIRLVTLSDILGRLGVLIYDLKIDLKSSAYIFKDKARKEGFEKISLITEKIIGSIKHLKNERHSKLHTGEAEINLLEGIVIWEELNKMVGADTPQILIEYTDEQIKDKVLAIKNSTIDIINLIRDFLEELALKFKENIEINE
jgi:hypothetical protein